MSATALLLAARKARLSSARFALAGVPKKSISVPLRDSVLPGTAVSETVFEIERVPLVVAMVTRTVSAVANSVKPTLRPGLSLSSSALLTEAFM